MKREKNTEEYAKFCNAYITAWDDARFAFLQGTTTYCPPKITVKALSVIFFDYLATHKEARKIPAPEALMLAFKDKWPCQGDNIVVTDGERPDPNATGHIGQTGDDWAADCRVSDKNSSRYVSCQRFARGVADGFIIAQMLNE